MAEGARGGASNAPQGDWGEHVHTYDRFLHLTTAGICSVIVTLVCLTLGGIGGAWWLAGFGVLATIGLTIGAINNPKLGWKPFVALLALILIIYALL